MVQQNNDYPRSINKNGLLFEIIFLAVICGFISGSIYLYRTTYLELEPLEHNIFRALRMSVLYFVIPGIWLVKVRGFKLSELGISKNGLLMSIILGVAVYSIALAIFFFKIGDPDFDKYFLWGTEKPIAEFIPTLILISSMAASTDIWTRGMIMMPVLKTHGLLLAVLFQNIFWFTSHIYEIEYLAESMTFTGAIVLTLTLGILGDFVAIKTKNIIGLSVGHIVLNVVFFGYVRLV